jgi:hypothetical protein
VQNLGWQTGALESLDDARAFGVVLDDIFKGKYKLKRMVAKLQRLINYNILLFEALEKLVAIESLHVLITTHNMYQYVYKI